jgi:Spy/CpxP family protein refolding chaperone
MKKSILRLTTLLIATALAATGGSALADGGAPPCAHHGHAMSPSEHLDRLTPILGLSAAQQAAAKKMARELTARTEPLTRQAGAQHDEMRALLESSSPDATRIGQKMIAIHAIHEQLEAIHRQELARFEGLLDAGQRAKLAKLHADKAGKHGRHGHGAPAGDAAD